MNFHSTRSTPPGIALEQAIEAGIAPDGGLYVPLEFPDFSPQDFAGLVTAAEVGEVLLGPFFADDSLSVELGQICREAFDFPLPLTTANDADTAVLELFHGPTSAFKDVGAQFLAACLNRIQSDDSRELTILVATSGDTGGAVASAFESRPSIRVVVLFPRGMVSPRQEHQLCCWPEHIRSYRVNGSFDDCQQMVKAAFADVALGRKLRMTSANSISIGRLLPQMVYYATSSLAWWRETGEAANYIIPTGNLGNATACIWARRAGLPIDVVALASNANQSIPRYFETGQWQPEKTVETLASAMDVGNPSNMERLRTLFPSVEDLARGVSAWSVSDAQISASIAQAWEQLGVAFCPHTATAWQVRQWLKGSDPERRWIVVATAHPAKFETIVEPIIGRPLVMPDALAGLLERPAAVTDIEAGINALRDALMVEFSQH